MKIFQLVLLVITAVVDAAKAVIKFIGCIGKFKKKQKSAYA